VRVPEERCYGNGGSPDIAGKFWSEKPTHFNLVWGRHREVKE